MIIIIEGAIEKILKNYGLLILPTLTLDCIALGM